jgi:hypothetical protein
MGDVLSISSVGLLGTHWVCVSSSWRSSHIGLSLSISYWLLGVGGYRLLNTHILDPLLGRSSNVVVSLRIVYNLSFNWNVLYSVKSALNWLLNHHSLLNLTSNILNLCFNGIIVSNGSLIGHTFTSNYLLPLSDLSLVRDLNDLLNLFIFSIFLLKRNVFNSALNGDVTGWGSSD